MANQSYDYAKKPPVDGADKGGYDKGGYDKGGYDKGGYDKGGYDKGKDSCGAVVNPMTLSMCENVAYRPFLSPLPVIAKVPIVLAERTVQVDIETKIKLDVPAIEIKRIRKELFLTQCKLLPRVGKLFLSGFIRKNIEFATADRCCNDSGDCVSGDIRHTTCKVPFDCVTEIPYVLGARPLFRANEEPTLVQTFSPKLMGADPSVQDFESVQYFNEKIFCELVSARFNEIDISFEDKKYYKDYDGEFEFQKFTEKITVFITFKLLQNQQVPIGDIGDIGPCENNHYK